MHVYGTLTATISASGKLAASLSPGVRLDGQLTIPSVANAPRFDGAYTYVPTEQEQIIPIENLMAREDITIEPIPSNYGLITWDGRTLTVS